MAKKINVRPVNELLSSVHNTNDGIVFSNGEKWRNHRKTFLQLIKRTGFETSFLHSNIESIWPKLKNLMTKSPSLVVGLYDPMSTDKESLLYNLELVLIELVAKTCFDTSVFPNGDVPIKYLQLFNAFRSCGIQRIEATLWYR